MPTGYTSAVADGTITTLREFALRCARAFGATISMRDEPMDAPIPAYFPASSPYHREHVAKAYARLQRLKRMSPIEAQREMQQRHAEDMAYWRRRTTENAQQQARYKTVLAHAIAWSPPADEHQSLKEFMVRQLRESSEFDDDSRYLKMPRLGRWPEWLVDQVAKTERDIAYHAKHQAEDTLRAIRNTAWIRDLRESLPL